MRALHGTKQRKTAPQGRYRFHPLEARHLTLISLWLGRPHVAQWWSDPEEQIEKLRRNLVDQSFEALIMLLEDRPVGYLQVYDASPGALGASLDQPPGTRGLDLFIGEGNRLGQGHGPAFARLITERRLAGNSVHRVIADPHPDNHRSIRCFEKAGFAREREILRPSGPAVLMVRSRDRLKK